MTCIVGLIDEEKVYIGGDRQATDGGGRIWNLSEEKVWKKKDAFKELIFGAAGSSRGAQLLAYSSAIPPIKEGQTLYEYLTMDFTHAMKEALHLGGELHDYHNVESHFNHFILGYKGRLFTFFSDMGFAEVVEKYTAVGSGAKYALGSLYTTENTDMSSKERIELALQASQQFDAYVQGPYDIVSIDKEKTEVKDYSEPKLDLDNIWKRANELMAKEDDTE